MIWQYFWENAALATSRECCSDLDATLVVGFDHAHCDALTVDLALRRVRELYLDPDTSAAPVNGSSIVRTRRYPQREAGRRGGRASPIARLAKVSSPPTGTPSPPFPLPLGEIPANGAPQCTRVVELDDDAAQALGGGAGARSAKIRAARRDRRTGWAAKHSPTVIPVHTCGRSSSPWHRTAGWLVTNAPCTGACRRRRRGRARPEISARSGVGPAR